MHVKFKAADLIEALGIMSIVEARALSPQRGSGAYLFNCFHKEEDGTPWVHIHSRSDNQVARAGFPLEELDGEGQFTFPVQFITVFATIPEDDVTIEATTETKSDGQAFVLKVRSSSGVKWDLTGLDPRLVAPCDRALKIAQETGKVIYNVGVMCLALSTGRRFLPGPDRKDNIDEHWNTLQIFDRSDPEWAKGDGHMFASDSTRAFFFQTSDFEGKGLTIHSRHLGQLVDFLGRCTSPEVAICRGTNMTFAVNCDRDQIFGWVHQVQTHGRFRKPGAAEFVLRVPKGPLLDGAAGVEIATGRRAGEHAVLHYRRVNPKFDGAPTVHLSLRESVGTFSSAPVPVGAVPGETSLDEDFQVLVRIADFRSLLSDTKGHEIELRVSRLSKGAAIWTVETFTLSETGKVVVAPAKAAETVSGGPSAPTLHTCQVTRFMPSTI